MPAKFLAASPVVRKARCNRGLPPVYPPLVLGWATHPALVNLAQNLRQESCAKFAPRILAQNLRQEFLRKICAKNSCAIFAPRILRNPGGIHPPLMAAKFLAKFAPGILAQSLRQESLRKVCAKNSCAKFAPRILAISVESCSIDFG